jgi:biopolymer transport protein ExbB
MIQVFNVMAVAGTSNARLMAGGVSAATIPTMAGLVAALSGYYFAGWLQRRADDEIQKVADLLVACVNDITRLKMQRSTSRRCSTSSSSC